MAFGRVHRLREESKEKRRLKREYIVSGKVEVPGKDRDLANGHASSHPPAINSYSRANGRIESRGPLLHLAKAESSVRGNSRGPDSSDTDEEPEVIL